MASAVGRRCARLPHPPELGVISAEQISLERYRASIEAFTG